MPQSDSNPRTTDLLQVLRRGAGVALTVQILGVALGYSAQVLLARWMGAAEYGVYEYVVTWALFLAFAAGLGMPGAVLRFLPQYVAQQDWARLKGMVWASFWGTVGVSLAIALVGTGLLWGLGMGWTAPLMLAVWLTPLQALQRIQLEMARGMRQIALAYGPSLIGLPLLLMLSGGLMCQRQQWLMGAAPRQWLTGEMAIALTMLVLGLLLSVQLWLFWRGFGGKLRAVVAEYRLRSWLAVALPFLLIDGSFVVLRQTDTLMIGMMVGTSSVGVYAAALKTSAWVNFILLAVNAIAAPMFAALYAEGDRVNLQRLASVVARWMFPLALLVSLGLVVFADPILGLFGAEFGVAKPAMLWLIGGQLVNVAAGSVGYLLTMTGHQNQCAIAMGCSAGLNLGLNLVLIPRFGVLGAAIATAICMSVWNLWLHALVVKHLGIRPSIWGAVFGGG